MGNKIKLRQSKNNTLVVDSVSSQCVGRNSFATEKMHEKSIKSGIEIVGTGTIELQACDACSKTYVSNKLCMLLVQSGLDSTAIVDQGESLLYLSQSGDYGSTFDGVSHAHCGNQKICFRCQHPTQAQWKRYAHPHKKDYQVGKGDPNSKTT